MDKSVILKNLEQLYFNEFNTNRETRWVEGIVNDEHQLVDCGKNDRGIRILGVWWNFDEGSGGYFFQSPFWARQQ